MTATNDSIFLKRIRGVSREPASGRSTGYDGGVEEPNITALRLPRSSAADRNITSLAKAGSIRARWMARLEALPFPKFLWLSILVVALSASLRSEERRVGKGCRCV